MWFTLAKLTRYVYYSNLSSYSRVHLCVMREGERGWSENTPLLYFVCYFFFNSVFTKGNIQT